MNRFPPFSHSTDIPFLQSLAHELKTQDNRITASPVFLVQQKVRHYGYDPVYTDKSVWLDSDGEECPPDTPGAEEVGYMDRWETVTYCFTEKAANRFIQENAHRYDMLRVYADSLYRNHEMVKVREILAEIGAHYACLQAKYHIAFNALCKINLGEDNPREIAAKGLQDAIDVGEPGERDE